MRIRPLLLPGILCLIVTLALAACGAAKGQPPADLATPRANGHYQIGNAATIGTYVVTVNRVLYRDQLQGVAPASGKQFVVIDLYVQNLDTNNARMSPAAQFVVYDPDGTEYLMDGDVDPTTDLSTSQLPNVIPALGTIHGEIAFQVPVNAPALELRFNPSFLLSLMSHGKEITFDLS